MPLLRLGSSGPAVTSLQARLKELNIDPGPVDGQFGPSTGPDERICTFNTSSCGHPFNKYDNLLGNHGPPDGALFKGRGFVQLTGRANCTQFSAVLGMGTQLVDNPDLANDPDIAAQLLAAFLDDKEDRIRQALQAGDLATARKLVNGGTHGLAGFKDTFQRGQGLVPDDVQVQVA